MRGRDKLRRYERFFTTVAKVINVILSKRIQTYIFYKSDKMGGKLGILIRYILLKNLAKKSGFNISIHKSTFILNLENITFGDNVSIHPLCYIDGTGGIEIGTDVSIAHGVTIMSTEHNYDDRILKIKDQGVSNHFTLIKNNVWIGAKATILAGKIIEEGNIVAAGAIVTKNFNKKNVILAGSPARIIKERF